MTSWRAYCLFLPGVDGHETRFIEPEIMAAFFRSTTLTRFSSTDNPPVKTRQSRANYRFALPADEHSPTGFDQRLLLAPVSRNVFAELLAPERHACKHDRVRVEFKFVSPFV